MPNSIVTKKQYKVFSNVYSEKGITYRADVTVQFDDDCGNGHNSFDITTRVDRKAGNGRWVEDSGGCQHDLVVKYFLGLAHLVKWHLCSTDGPMHYIKNTQWFVQERDCWGLLKGELKQFIDKKTGLPMWERAIPYAHVGSFQQDRTVFSHTKPDPVIYDWKPYGRMGKGKARDLDAARRVAVWLDATEEDLIAPGLGERLRVRLPFLLEAMRRDMEELGFTW